MSVSDSGGRAQSTGTPLHAQCYLPRSVVSRQVMQELEDAAFNQGLPQAALMEQAVQQLASRIAALAARQDPHPRVSPGRAEQQPKRLVFLCGNGGNGADAWGVARTLSLAGFSCFAYRIPGEQTELNRCQESYAHSCGVKPLPPQKDHTKLLELCAHADLVIDGLAGFGFQGQARGPLADLLGMLSDVKTAVVSIDLPSGLEADGRQNPEGIVAVRAALTLALGCLKPVHCDDQFLPFTGVTELLNLDLVRPHPDRELAQCVQSVGVVDELIRQLGALPLNAHKYTRGRCAVVAGSPAYPGAALLALGGALAAGPGYVTLYNDDPQINLAAAARWPSITCASYSEVPSIPSSRTAGESSAARPAALLSGPGLTNHTPALLETLRTWNGPVVLDAGSLVPEVVSALTPVASAASLLAPRILTPHQGEFDRLWGHFTARHPGLCAPSDTGKAQSNLNRLERLRTLCLHLNCSIILKGPCTLIGFSTGRCLVHLHPNPDLARAGTGDVLSGFLAGLLSRGVPEECALPAAVVLHSRAGLKAFSESHAPGPNGAGHGCFASQLIAALAREQMPTS